MQINPHRIRAFAVAAREGSFSVAATRLGISQSAVSHHIAALEKDVGAQVFHRARTGLELTPAGRTLHELADRWSLLEAALTERIVGLAQRDVGHLSVVANSPRPALDHIARFQARYPGVDVSFSLLAWTSAMERLRGRTVDVGIVTEPSRLDGWKATPIGAERYCAYLRADDPLAGSASVSLEQLAADRTVLLPEQGSFTRRAVRQRLSRLKLTLPRTMEITTFPLIREAVLQGIGVGVFLSGATHRDDPIVTAPIEEMPEEHATVLVTRHEGGHLAAVRAFADMVAEADEPSRHG